ncbi:hypothetical protein XENTR_v10007288 [Xenopus tropicalis]|nr:hypothetical protein XENTR_v10007288 [Xenopus tropicalis]
MAAAWRYRMDAGDFFVSNCFPARTLLRSTDRGGRWVKTQRVWGNRRMRLVRSAASDTYWANPDTVLTEPTWNGPLSKSLDPQQNVLNASFLLKTHFVKTPADLYSVDVSDRNLTSAQEEELAQFQCVAYINAAENFLTLGTFCSFPALRELDLSMNNIRNVRLRPGDLPKLELLDLSYNNLSPDDISQLGVLSHLRVLHLSGNSLSHLPPDMSAPHGKDLSLTLFSALEILMLDDNNLSHPAVFLSLATLTRLRVLNLDNNSICGIPYLYPADGGHVTDPPNEQEKGTETLVPDQESQQERLEEDDGVKMAPLDYTVGPSKDDPDRTEVVFTNPANSQQGDHVTKSLDTTESFRFLSHTSEDGMSQSLPPLPSLRYLSLANNKIRHQEKLLAAALFPSLEELVIHGNPLTSLRKGDPPLLSHVLQQRLGIHITRKKSPGIRKPPLFIPVKEGRKVQSVIPKVPKQPLMAEPLGIPSLGPPFDSRHLLHDGNEYSLSPSPLPPIPPSSKSQREPGRALSAEDSGHSPEAALGVEMSPSPDDAASSIFMTQVDDLPEPSGGPSQLGAEQQKEVPEKFKGYEELFCVQTDPDFIDPVGIQSNVQALQNALKHLLVYGDPKPRLPGLQQPFIPTQGKFGKAPTPLPRKHKKEILGQILVGMREPRHLTQVPLGE